MTPAILLLTLIAKLTLGAADAPPIDPSNDLSPMCFVMLLIALCAVLFLVGAGMVAAGAVAISAAFLIALGIVSSATLIGVLRRRFSTGFRALHYQLCAVAALPAGIGALLIGAHFITTHLRLREILAIGSVAGICAGLLLAFVFDRLAAFAYRRFVASTIPNPTGNA